MAPIGYFLGGALGSLFNVQASLIVGVIEMFVGAVWVVRSSVARIHDLPTEPVLECAT